MTGADWTRLRYAGMAALHLRPSELDQMPPCDLVDLLECAQAALSGDAQTNVDADGVMF